MALTDFPAVSQALAQRPALAARLNADPQATAWAVAYFASPQGQAGLAAADGTVHATAAIQLVSVASLAYQEGQATINWLAILQYLAANLPAIISIIVAMIPMFAFAPAPTPVNPPVPPVIPVVS